MDLVKPDLGNVIQDKQIKMKKYHDQHAKGRTFYVGDPVYAYNFLSKPKWIEGVIEEKVGPVTFLVKLRDGRQWKRHVDHLKLQFPEKEEDLEFEHGKEHKQEVPTQIIPVIVEEESIEGKSDSLDLSGTPTTPP